MQALAVNKWVRLLVPEVKMVPSVNSLHEYKENTTAVSILMLQLLFFLLHTKYTTFGPDISRLHT